MTHHPIKVFADYNQFYVWDAGMSPLAPEDYTDTDVTRMVKVSPHVLVVQPVRNSTVPVEIEVHASDPGLRAEDWDHVVECALEVSTGRLQVHECTGGPVLDLEIAPGPYQARVLFAGLGTISEDGLDGEDRYRVDLWPGEFRDLAVAKQWSSERAG
jgi:hypothetical protein